MDNKSVMVGCVVGCVSTMFFIGIMFAFSDISYDDGVKAGQIEALTGKIKYELVTNSDSTRTWEKKDSQ